MPAMSNGSPPQTGSVISGHDVTPPDEMYDTATLPRDMAPPRYSSENVLSTPAEPKTSHYASHDLLGSVDQDDGRGALLMTSTQDSPQMESATNLSRSRSSSQPLETAM